MTGDLASDGSSKNDICYLKGLYGDLVERADSGDEGFPQSLWTNRDTAQRSAPSLFLMRTAGLDHGMVDLPERLSDK